MGFLDFFRRRPDREPDGSSPEKAIVVTDVGAEYAWLREHYSGFDRATQSVSEIDGKFFDVHVLIKDEGDERTVYFDISEFYGESPDNPDRSNDAVTIDLNGEPQKMRL